MADDWGDDWGEPGTTSMPAAAPVTNVSHICFNCLNI